MGQPPAQTWVLDANVLRCAGSHCAKNADQVISMAALEFLMELKHRHRIAHDQDGRMLSEYERTWRAMAKDQKQYPSHLIAHSFWDALMSQRPPMRRQTKLPRQAYRRLEARNMKPDGDLAYVEAAYATEDRLIASEDSDFFSSSEGQDILREHGINVLRVRSALKKARSGLEKDD